MKYNQMNGKEKTFFNRMIMIFKNNECNLKEVIERLNKLYNNEVDLKKYVDNVTWEPRTRKKKTKSNSKERFLSEKDLDEMEREYEFQQQIENGDDE